MDEVLIKIAVGLAGGAIVGGIGYIQRYTEAKEKFDISKFGLSIVFGLAAGFVLAQGDMDTSAILLSSAGVSVGLERSLKTAMNLADIYTKKPAKK